MAEQERRDDEWQWHKIKTYKASKTKHMHTRTSTSNDNIYKTTYRNGWVYKVPFNVIGVVTLACHSFKRIVFHLLERRMCSLESFSFIFSVTSEQPTQQEHIEQLNKKRSIVWTSGQILF